MRITDIGRQNEWIEERRVGILLLSKKWTDGHASTSFLYRLDKPDTFLSTYPFILD